MHTTAFPLGREAAGWLLGQLVVLTTLGGHVGAGPVAWLAAAAYTAVMWGALTTAFGSPWDLGPANRVTVGRAALVGGVVLLVAEAVVTGSTAHTALLVVLASVALALDAVDGQVARRTGSESALGARFDMEVDAFLILVLSVSAAVVTGPWVLVIGAMRYLFVAASWFASWLRAELPPNLWRKAVCAVQGVVLLVVTARVLPDLLSVVVAAAALAALLWSFGRDTGRLWQGRAAVAGARHGREFPPNLWTWGPAECAHRIART
ncbi:CDP-alcohol phosphatidyltransferase family protein [Saccharothrix sp. AJ9571]|nr:CDP-alcohol phosphatidyltransferase family protein [Saccharothrix sp. AJ9571]